MGPMMTDMPMHYAGSGFPWGLLILAGIGYFLWSKGVFDGRRFGNGGRWGGPGGPGGPSGYGPGPGAGYSPAQPVENAGYGAGQGSYGDQRAAFEEWHRQAHASGAEHGHHAAPSAPAAENAPGGEQTQSGTSV
jgi:hypothetical protein